MLPKHFIISCDIDIVLPEPVSNLDSNNIISNEEAVNLLLYRLLTQIRPGGNLFPAADDLEWAGSYVKICVVMHKESRSCAY